MLLEGFYILAKILVLYIQRRYYKHPVVLNEPFTKIDKPTILVSNHPNTLLDAVFAAAAVSKQVNFLANYSLFKSKFGNWFFNTFYCIPVQRPEDVQDGKTNNTASMAKSHAFLAGGGTLYIAAEGYSVQTLGIRPLKTGSARIALGTEHDQDWQAGVQILPIGLNYDKADRYRSNLVVHVGKPFQVDEWKYDYLEEPNKCAKALTTHLTEQMRSVLLDTDQDRTLLLQRIRSYFKALHATDPKREYLRTRNQLVDIKAMDDQQVQSINAEIDQFEANCSKNKITGTQVAAAKHDQDRPIQLSKLLLSLPLTILGTVLNFLPYLLCHWIDKKANKHLVYRSTFKTMTGIILFPLMYLFWMWCISTLTNNVILTLGSILIYRRSGEFAWLQIQDWKRYFRSRHIIAHDPQHIDHLNLILSSFSKHSAQ